MSGRATSLEPKSRFTINLALRRKQTRKELPDQKSGRKQKEKIPNQRMGGSRSTKRKEIPDQGLEEKRRNMQKGLLDQTISEQYRFVTKKTWKERKPRPKVVLSLDYLPKSYVSVTCSPRAKQKPKLSVFEDKMRRDQIMNFFFMILIPKNLTQSDNKSLSKIMSIYKMKIFLMIYFISSVN